MAVLRAGSLRSTGRHLLRFLLVAPGPGVRSLLLPPMMLSAQLRTAIHRHLQQALVLARRHPRRVSAGVLISLGGFAATAFGTAPLATGQLPVPQQVLTETVAVAGLDAQLEALASHSFDLHRSTTSRKSDTADSLLRRLGASDAGAVTYLRQDRAARRLLEGQPGKLVQARVADDGSLLELVARFPALDSSRAGSHFTRLTVRRGEAGFHTLIETAALKPELRLGTATVRGSLWAAVDEARLPDAIAAQMIEIFAGDIDFHRELKRGDSFSVVYEALTADGEPITWNEGTGRVMAAEYRNKGRRFQALWYADPDSGKGAYYSFDGKSRRKAFLASPLEFSRVTSGFAMRMHPILNTWRQHNGVDYAAPTGTPVKTVGDGKVTFAGRQQGYGNVVQVEHARDKTTIYAHLSRIDVRAGQVVSQGQKIGAVGATGWATGPHLHFEFKVNGQFVDPLVYAASATTPPIDADDRPRFTAWADQARHKLSTAESLAGFRGDAE